MTRRFVSALLCCATLTAATGSASAAEPAADEPRVEAEPALVSGQTRPEKLSGDALRDVGEVVLFVPRNVINALFLTTQAAYGLVENEQVVPRIRDAFFTEDETIGIFPTAFVETGFNPNVGARMLANVGHFGSTVRAGYGGPDVTVVELRLRVVTFTPAPAVVGIELQHDRRTDLGYVGLGRQPAEDPRNVFRADTSLRGGLYREVRERGIATFGFRLLPDLELLASTSYRRRRADDPPDADLAAMSQVFEADSVPGAADVVRSSYTEVAVRADTRTLRGPPETGWLMEGYGGLYHALTSSTGDGIGTGGRVAAFVPVYRVTNILSPGISIETVKPVGDLPLDFRDYAVPASYRGLDDRRDQVAAVASLDYRWTLMRYLAARLFTDASTVAPSIDQLNVSHLRHAVGFGIDLHSSSSELGSLAFSYSPEGVRFFFAFGVSPSGFGDRQHR